MAKTNRFIVEYKDCIRSTSIQTSDNNPPELVIRRSLRLFKEIEDDRVQGMIDYPLSEILLIAFHAILGNTSKWDEIEDFGNAHKRWIKKF